MSGAMLPLANPMLVTQNLAKNLREGIILMASLRKMVLVNLRIAPVIMVLNLAVLH